MSTLETIVVPVLEEIAETIPAARRVGRGPDAALVGAGSPLDSLALVTFIVAVEARVRDKHGVDVVLASERAMSRRHSPFRTLGTLAAWVDELVLEASAGGHGESTK